MKQDKIIRFILLVLALTAISGLVLITVFIFKEGVPLIFRVGFRDFFLSSNWSPTHPASSSSWTGCRIPEISAVFSEAPWHSV